jgi:hypothetical protein
VASKTESKSEPVGVGAKLRKTHPWFETLASRAKDDAVKKRQKAERANGSRLNPEELDGLADELEKIQRELNPLETRRKEILAKLLPHWGYTGIEEIVSPMGKTLISTSFELCVDPSVIEEKVSGYAWQRITKRILQAPLLLASGKTGASVRDAIEKAVAVRKLKVSVTSPSSRRPKSGETADAEDAEDETE